MPSYLLIAALGAAGGSILLLVVKSVIETVVFIRAAARTDAAVIRLATTRNSDGQTMYLPVFAYRTNDGGTYQYTSTVASQPPAYRIGETARIFYLRKNPHNAKLDSFWELWALKIVFAAIGAGCLIAAVTIFASAK